MWQYVLSMNYHIGPPNSVGGLQLGYFTKKEEQTDLFLLL